MSYRCCPNCGYEFKKGPRRYWTEERVIAAIQKWAEDHGRQPTLNDWEKSTPWTPSQATVRERFGTWNHAIEAAGFAPRPWRKREAA